MGLHGKTLHIRLGELDKKFSLLHEEYGALTAGLLGRLIVASVLEKPIEEQVAIVQAQLKGKAAQERPPANRLPPANSNRKNRP